MKCLEKKTGDGRDVSGDGSDGGDDNGSSGSGGYAFGGEGGDVKPASLHCNYSVSVECGVMSEHCLHYDATQSEGHNSNMAPPDCMRRDKWAIVFVSDR